MASITYEKVPSKKAKSGYTWKVRIPYKDEFGIEQTTCKSGFATKSKAKAYAVKTLAEIEKGLRPVKDTKTVNDLWKLYLDTDGKGIRPGTMRGYRGYYENHIQPAFGKAEVKNVTYLALQKFFNERSYMSHSAIATMKCLVNHLFELALKLKLIQYNPVRDVRLYEFQPVKKRDQYFQLDELERVTEEILEHRFQISSYSYIVLMYLGYYLGLRIGEAIALSWDDIDFEENTVNIHSQVRETPKAAEMVRTELMKTPASKAVLPLPYPLKEILLEWKSYQETKIKTEKICCSNKGHFLGHVNARQFLRNWFKEVGIEDFHFHALRHTFITNVVQHCDPKTASKLARHENVDVTLQVYTEVQDDRLADIMNLAFPKIERVLS